MIARIKLVLILLSLFLPLIGFAKRVAPRRVEPVLTPTIRIEAPLDDGRIGRIQAFDRVNGRCLWSLVVFEVKLDPGLEEDVQWRFITSMKVVGDALEVTAEGGARYRVMLASRLIEKLAAMENVAHEISSANTGRLVTEDVIVNIRECPEVQ